MTDKVKQYEVLNWASLFLEKHQSERKIAEIWLQHLLGMTRTAFFMNMREPLPEEVVSQFKEGIEKHVETGIPIQHLIGSDSFYGRTFSVNENVLIPRPETEELVHHIIETSRESTQGQSLTIADIGTGSGIIAITLALEIPDSSVLATDISEEALHVARQNANRLGAPIQFFQGNFLQPLVEQQVQVDIIVSNPPYIARTDEAILSRTVKDFDPELALFADDNGLAAYKQILALAPQVVKPNGRIVFEIGHEQGDDVRTLIKGVFPMCKVTVIQDINGKDRIVSAALLG